MKVRLASLEITFKDARVIIPFSPQLTFIHGQVGTGKSSIARLADWCLGDDETEFTPALEDELIAAVLRLEVGDHDVRIARDREDKSHVVLSWSRPGEAPHNEVVPLQASGGDRDPAVAETLSDHLFVLADLTPLRVPRSRKAADSPLQRLSFRDFLAFCYLPQETLNVSLMRFGTAFQGPKSADVMRAMLGLYSEHQQQLQVQSASLLRRSNLLTAEAAQISTFLDRMGVEGSTDVERDMAAAQTEVRKAEEARAALAADRLPATHPSEKLRAELRALERELAERQTALVDTDERIARDDRLRAELITAQLKLDRSTVAVEVLSDVRYAHCPQCGSTVAPAEDPSTCHLCHNHFPAASSPLPLEASESDLQLRVDELAEALERHRLARAREARKLRARETARRELDAQLAQTLRAYESTRLAAVRDIERRLATAQGDVKRLSSVSRLRSEVKRLHEESGRLLGQRKPVQEELKTENERLAEHERYRELIAAAFREALLEVGMPTIGPNDRVVITNKLVPRIEPASGRAAYEFKNLGSSGMKTLFQCCYALALHRVAVEQDLLLPRFLIIDTPTQHVDERVDEKLIRGFFRYLYKLLDGPMRSVQIILIDSVLEQPPGNIKLAARKMRLDDPAYPPLVPYYKSEPLVSDEEGTSVNAELPSDN
jgi:hypothetical protein